MHEHGYIAKDDSLVVPIPPCMIIIWAFESISSCGAQSATSVPLAEQSHGCVDDIVRPLLWKMRCAYSLRRWKQPTENGSPSALYSLRAHMPSAVT